MNKHEINKELNNLFRTTEYTCLIELNNACCMDDDIVGIALEDSKEELIDFTEPNNFCKFVSLFGAFLDYTNTLIPLFSIISGNYKENTLEMILSAKDYINEDFIELIQNEEWV